jgi:hypothetical protein
VYNDDCASPPSYTSCVTYAVVGGYGYAIQVDGHAGATGSVTVSISSTPAVTVSAIASRAFFVGARQAVNSLKPFTGWSWVDGTDASNLNCADYLCSTGNVWSYGDPKYVVQVL